MNNKPIRVATTITNVTPGTIGADNPASFALLDLIATANRLIADLRSAGKIGYADAREADRALETVRSVAWAPVDRYMEEYAANLRRLDAAIDVHIDGIAAAAKGLDK